MRIALSYKVTIRDSEGRTIHETPFSPSHSYVIQFLELIEAFLDGHNKDATDTLGSEERIVTASQVAQTKGRVDAPVNNDDYGILVGTNAGATAEGNENFQLDTKIADGSGAGQLLYGACTLVAPYLVGPPAPPFGTVDLNIIRTFENQSGGSITVKEIGVVCGNTTINKYHLLLRDVILDQPILNDNSLTVQYRMHTQSP